MYKIFQALQIGSLYLDSKEIIKLYFGHSIYADFVFELRFDIAVFEISSENQKQTTIYL